MDSRVKLDPLAYVLLIAVIGLQVYSSFLRDNGVEATITASDHVYQSAVFESSEDQGVLHQIFRQNEVDRELLKALLRVCAK